MIGVERELSALLVVVVEETGPAGWWSLDFKIGDLLPTVKKQQQPKKKQSFISLQKW